MKLDPTVADTSLYTTEKHQAVWFTIRNITGFCFWQLTIPQMNMPKYNWTNLNIIFRNTTLMDNNTEITDVRILATKFMMYKIGKFSFFVLVTKQRTIMRILHWINDLEQEYL